jgi:AcrR family transcriptional regulator
VFAEAGFRAATVRAICQRAGANVAAVNYHFGDKEQLYLEVLRDAYRASLEKYPEDFGLVPRATPPQRLEAFVQGFLLRLFDPGPCAWHWQLLALEMIQPTAALDALVAERIRPLAEQMRGIVNDLVGPDADPESVRLCGSSIVGQCLFYRHCQSVISRLFPEQGFEPDAIARIARHITRFSLAGLKAATNGRAPLGPERTRAVRGTPPSPSPQPSPLGRGVNLARASSSPRPAEFSEGGRRFCLFGRERAGGSGRQSPAPTEVSGVEGRAGRLRS